VEGAILVESNWLSFCNNNVILAQEPSAELLRERLRLRGLNDDQIAKRLGAQYDHQSKARGILEAIAESKTGKLIHYDSSRTAEAQIPGIFEQLRALSIV
jgi:hypothetical protein